RRCRVDLDGARPRERLQEVLDERLVARLDDHVQRVLAPNDGLTLDLDALLPNVGTAEVVEERRTRVRTHRRASFGLVVMANHEKSHENPPSDDASAHASPQGLAGKRSCPRPCRGTRARGSNETTDHTTSQGDRRTAQNDAF